MERAKEHAIVAESHRLRTSTDKLHDKNTSQFIINSIITTNPFYEMVHVRKIGLKIMK